MHRGLIGIGLQKWLKQAAFIPFRVRNNKFVERWMEQRNIDFEWVSESKEQWLRLEVVN